MPQSNKPKIEDILKASHQAQPRLDLKEKQAIFNQVLQSALPQEQQGDKFSWYKDIKIFILGLSSVAAAILIIININNLSNTEKFAQLNYKKNETLKVININNNENINVEIETSTLLSQNYQYRTSVISLDEIIGEKGGGPGFNSSTWQINELNNAIDNPEYTKALKVSKITPEKLDHIANVFSLNSEDFKRKYSNLPDQDISFEQELCVQDRYSLYEDRLDDLHIDLCVSVDDTGFFSLEQTEQATSANGLDEAKKYFKSLTGYQDHEYEIIENTNIIDYGIFSNDKEYDIYIKTDLLNQAIPYYPLPWHVVIRNGKLSSLMGRFITPVDVDSFDTNLINSQQAYDRLVSDFANGHPGENVFLPLSSFIILNDLGISDDQVVIDITEMKLVYEIAVARDYPFNYYLVPLYFVQAEEINTNTTFSVYINAAEKDPILWAWPPLDILRPFRL